MRAAGTLPEGLAEPFGANPGGTPAGGARSGRMTAMRNKRPPRGGAEIIDFEAALLDACPTDRREELIAEATLLADALSPEGRFEELQAMASALTDGDGADRPRARLLAAALRQLANRLAA